MRLSPGDELDLRWFIHEAGAALGERSAFGIQLEMARDGLSPTGNSRGPDMDKFASAIRRYDRIRARLDAMPRRSRRVLVDAYTSEIEDLRSLDRLGPVVLLTEAARNAYKRALAKVDIAPSSERSGRERRLSARKLAIWISSRMKSDAKLKEAVLAEADEMLSKACADWRMAR